MWWLVMCSLNNTELTGLHQAPDLTNVSCVDFIYWLLDYYTKKFYIKTEKKLKLDFLAIILFLTLHVYLIRCAQLGFNTLITHI